VTSSPLFSLALFWGSGSRSPALLASGHTCYLPSSFLLLFYPILLSFVMLNSRHFLSSSPDSSSFPKWFPTPFVSLSPPSPHVISLFTSLLPLPPPPPFPYSLFTSFRFPLPYFLLSPLPLLPRGRRGEKNIHPRFSDYASTRSYPSPGLFSPPRGATKD